MARPHGEPFVLPATLLLLLLSQLAVQRPTPVSSHTTHD